MIERIIFLMENRFSLRDYQRFGIELLQRKGFEVEVWDLSPILNPQLFQNYTPPDAFNYDGYMLFNDRLKMYSKLSDLSSRDFVINLVSYNYWNLGSYRALSKSGADYAVSYINAIPYPINKKGCMHLLREKLKELASLRYSKVWKRLFMKLPLRCLGVKPASLILAGGEKYLDYKYYFKYPIDKDTEVLQIHALDYDLYLKEKDKPCKESPIAVFIDEFYPFHPDYIIFKEKSPVSADSYYQLINTFFDLVEEKTGLEVIIAAHPRSNYESLPDYFNGRKCIRGKTISLIRESKLVLSHYSTALNFANLFYKPVIFMICSDLYKTYEGDYIKECARCFNKNAIFIDENNNIDWKRELMVSRTHYDNYRRSYIKPEHSEDLLFWQIVANRLKKCL